MFKINVGSLFRDNMIWHGRYINQVKRFFTQLYQQQCGQHNSFCIPHIVVLEGGSQDNTLEQLQQYKQQIEVDDCNKPLYNFTILQENKVTYGDIRSTAENTRIQELSKVGHRVMQEAAKDSDFVFWIESDLVIHDPYLIQKLCTVLIDNPSIGLIAPLIFLDTVRNYFYDTWAFRDIDGTQWTNKFPWSNSLKLHDNNIPMSSIGSCCLIRSSLVRDGINFEDGAFVQLCNNVRQANFEVVANKNMFVYHPSRGGLIHSRWI